MDWKTKKMNKASETCETITKRPNIYVIQILEHSSLPRRKRVSLKKVFKNIEVMTEKNSKFGKRHFEFTDSKS